METQQPQEFSTSNDSIIEFKEENEREIKIITRAIFELFCWIVLVFIVLIIIIITAKHFMK